MTFPGAGRAVWIGGSSGETTGRSTDWSTYDGTNDTAWQQWIDDTSSTLSSSYQVTNTERNSIALNGETAYLAVTNGSQEFIAKVEPDALDATSAQITLGSGYNMDRAELVNLNNKMLMTSTENAGSVVLAEHTPSGLNTSGVLTDAYYSNTTGDRGFGILFEAPLPDNIFDDSPNYDTFASTATYFWIGGRLNASTFLNEGSVGQSKTDVPTFRGYATFDWSGDLANPPSDSNINTIRNDMLTRTSAVNSIDHITELQSGSGGAWWTIDPVTQSAYAHRPQNAYLPVTSFHPTTLGTIDGSNGASSDRTFANYNGSSFESSFRQIVRPFNAMNSNAYLAALRAEFGSAYDYMKQAKISDAINITNVDWRGIRFGASGDQLRVGWTVYNAQVHQQQGVRNESQIFYNTTNNNIDVGAAYYDRSGDEGSLDSHQDGIYPTTYADPRIANNDRVAYISDTGRSAAELGEDLIQAIQATDSTWVGMYPDTTGTKGGNLYLTATSLTNERLYDIYENHALNYINADDQTTPESHASNSIAVSVTNGSDSTSTAFDPDTACLFRLHNNHFAVVWRKSTTAYISTFSVSASTSTPPTITRTSDAINLGTVPAGTISGVRFGDGVAMITCGNYYRIIKTDTI